MNNRTCHHEQCLTVPAFTVVLEDDTKHSYACTEHLSAALGPTVSAVHRWPDDSWAVVEAA